MTFGVADGDWNLPISIDLAVNPAFVPDANSQPVQNPPLQPHTLTDIRGKLVIEGGVPDGKSRELSVAVMLPTETDGELPIVNISLDENQQTDTLNVFNDGSIQNDTGELTATTITGLGMTAGKGIEYRDIEVVETLLGSGNDNFTVSGTAKGAITLVHGGGGNDTITVTGSDADGALILLGDSVQDGSTYNATSLQKTDKAREFTNAGNDIIDASGAGGSVVIYGGQGNDTLTGSEFDDHIAGGSGDDKIYALGGNDHIYGDSGFNFDISTRLDLSTQVLHVVNTADGVNDNPETADDLTAGNDTIEGGSGNDIIFGDKGEVTQTAGTNRILTTGAVVSITNTNRNLGGNDIIQGNSGDDVVIAGFGNDEIRGGAGNDILFGDSGALNYADGDSDISTLDTVITVEAAVGGTDTIYGNAGDDSIFGGAESDKLYGGNSVLGSAITDSDKDIIIGDLGGIALTGNRAVRIYTSNTTVGKKDTIEGNEDDDIILAGAGDDMVRGNAGNDWILGDFGEVDLRNNAQVLSTTTGNSHSTGDDYIDAGEGNNRILGGLGKDTINNGAGDDHIAGDNATLTYTGAGVIVSAVTTDLNLGDNDEIHAAEGNNLVLAGFGNDTVTAGSGNDVVVGDNGEVEYTGGTVTLIDTTDTVNSTGGNDRITLTGGNNKVAAGVGADTVTTGDGADQILGDNGTFNYDTAGVITSAFTTEHELGAADTIISGAGNDLILGGFAGDDITAGAGDDTVIGDNGQVDFLNGIRSEVFSTDTTNATGGDDTISLGSGEDQLIAGVGNDTVTNDSGETIIIGDDGRISSDENGRYLLARTGDTTIGGDDNVTGGSDRDIIFGGFGGDRLDGQAGDDLIGGDGTQVTRNPDTIVMEAVDLFVGGDDTILGGAGLDRLQGHFGSDLFFASFSEDVLVGEYARFTFDASTSSQRATFVISLAQGNLDLIRQLQTGLFSGFAQQVFAESNLGQAASSRTALTTAFTDDALNAFGRLNELTQTSSGTSPGVDIVLPTEPTAAGVESEAAPQATEGEASQEEATAETAAEPQLDEDGFVIQPEAVEATGEEAVEAAPEDAAEQTEEACNTAEGEAMSPEQAAACAAEAEQGAEAQNESAAATAKAPIDLQAALAGFAGWGVMKSKQSGQRKGSDKDSDS